MKKYIDNIQYISQETQSYNHLKNIEEALESGAKWIQLRIKNSSTEKILSIAEQVKEKCLEYEAIFILNDYVSIAQKVNADGVHLGKKDSCPLEARKILGARKIIGGTANSQEDIQNLIAKKVDYIGLGPYQNTSTKKDLSPFLGIQGYQELYAKIEIDIPVIAIGGITQKDALLLKQETKIHGIAISGLLSNKKENKKEILENLKNIFQ